jgi:hypothetical protein
MSLSLSPSPSPSFTPLECIAGCRPALQKASEKGLPDYSGSSVFLSLPAHSMGWNISSTLEEKRKKKSRSRCVVGLSADLECNQISREPGRRYVQRERDPGAVIEEREGGPQCRPGQGDEERGICYQLNSGVLPRPTTSSPADGIQAARAVQTRLTDLSLISQLRSE